MGFSDPNDAILQKRPTWIRFAAVACLLVTMSAFPACIAAPPGDTGLGWPIFLGGMAAMLALAQVSRWATRTARGPLQIDGRGITVGEHVIPAADLPAGVVCDVVDSRGVVLRPRGSTSTIDVSEPLLRPLIESLRLHFRAQPRFPVVARQTAGVTAITLLALMGIVGIATTVGSIDGPGLGVLGFLGSLVITWPLYWALGKRTLTVGSDAIGVRSPIGTQVLVSYSQVEAVTQIGTDVHLHLKGGRDYRVGFGLHATGSHRERCEARASMLAFFLEGAKHAYDHAGSLGATGRKAAVLARGGRDIREWMNALRALNETQASFRSATIPDDELWRIAEDPTEREPVRVAAAVALRDRLDEGGRQRLRLVVDSCVAPRLRVALDAAADRDDATLARALEELGEHDDASESAPQRRALT